MTKHIHIAGASLTEFQIIVRSNTHAELEAGTLLQKELKRHHTSRLYQSGTDGEADFVHADTRYAAGWSHHRGAERQSTPL